MNKIKMTNYEVAGGRGLDSSTLSELMEIIIPKTQMLINFKFLLEGKKSSISLINNYEDFDKETGILNFLLDYYEEKGEVGDLINLISFAEFNNLNAKLCLISALRYVNIIDTKIDNIVDCFAPLTLEEEKDMLESVNLALRNLTYFNLYELKLVNSEEMYTQVDSYFKKHNLDMKDFSKLVIADFLVNPARFGISEDYPEKWEKFISLAKDNTMVSDLYENMGKITLNDLNNVISGKIALDYSLLQEIQSRED